MPLGSSMFLNFKTKNTTLLRVKFTDSSFLFKNNIENDVSFKYSPKKTQEFFITNQNSFSSFIDSNVGNILITKDAFPEIKVNEFYDSSFFFQKFFDGKIKDDYGIEKLTFNYSLEEEVISVDIPISKDRINSFFPNFWNS